MSRWKMITVAMVTGLALASTAAASEREQLRIVGSSTVFPFTSYVAEEFGAITGLRTPVVEATGSGGGMRLFCDGVGLNTPDINNASRRMKTSEFDRCQDNGVNDIVEAQIGADGIVVAQSIDNEPLALTREQLTLAVAAQVPRGGELVDNPYTHWNQIDDALPERRIEVLGPPSTSGTRDAFEELVMEAVSESLGYPRPYSRIRADGPYVDSGENDNLIVQRIRQNREAVGIFGFSFLEENRDTIAGATIDGAVPTVESISSGEYPVSRSMWLYIKAAHEAAVTGLDEFLDLFMDELMIGEGGLLVDEGLIPMPAEQRMEWRQRVEDRVTVSRSDLE